jgi:hypothetical protein
MFIRIKSNIGGKKLFQKLKFWNRLTTHIDLQES